MIQLPPLQLCTHSPALSGLDKDDIKNKNKMEKKKPRVVCVLFNATCCGFTCITFIYVSLCLSSWW